MSTITAVMESPEDSVLEQDTTLNDASMSKIQEIMDPESPQEEVGSINEEGEDPCSPVLAAAVDDGGNREALFTAQGATRTPDSPIVSAQEAVPTIKIQKAPRMFLGVLAMATTGILVALLVVFLKNKTRGEPSSLSTTILPPDTTLPRPNRQARWEAITKLLEEKGLATPSSFLEPTAAQTRALDWLVYQDQTLTLLDTGIAQERFLQRYTLILFAFTLGVELWQTLNPWIEMVQTHECSFAGIDCNDKGQVVSMQLPYWRLSGTLPEELGFVLTAMTSLVMNHNKLDGTIPESLFQLTNLETLILYENNLQSTISPSIQKLTNLQVLYLGNNMFTGSLPITSLQALTKMQEFLLSNNQVEGPIFDAVLSWKYLSSLGLEDLPSVQATTLPSEIGQLTRLNDLVLGITHAGLPSEIGLLTELGILFVSAPSGGNAPASTLPTEIGQLTKLVELTINGDHTLTGTIPTELGLLTNVTFMDLSTSHLSGVLPSELGFLTNLNALLLGNCPNLEGTVPTQLGELARGLHTLVLHGTNLEGSLPKDFCLSNAEIYARCRLLTCNCCSQMFCVP